MFRGFGATMNNRRVLCAVLIFIALFIAGTIVVLSSVSYYFSINPAAYISEREVLYNDTAPNAHHKPERIQRIIHQTWKTETLPPRWRGISQACRDMMHD